jgi:hypothetical protein
LLLVSSLGFFFIAFVVIGEKRRCSGGGQDAMIERVGDAVVGGFLSILLIVCGMLV